MGKCPSCGNMVAGLNGDGVEVYFSQGNSFKAVTYSCPSCSVVLGCEIDPVALRTDIVNMTAEAVLRQLQR